MFVGEGERRDIRSVTQYDFHGVQLCYVPGSAVSYLPTVRGFGHVFILFLLCFRKLTCLF